jgi:hypothetical protein
MTREELCQAVPNAPVELLRSIERDGVTKENVALLFNVWLNKTFKDELPWVENVTLIDASITVEHSYPDGIDIRPQIRDIVRRYYQGQETLELVLKRVEPR